jgi:hypothetical protein
MMGFRKRLVSSVEYEPVVYDVSIVEGDKVFAHHHGFAVCIREDDKIMHIYKPTLQEAQEVMDLLKPDVFVAPDVPWSVFCPCRKISYAVA